jgi:hydrogenase nickel incorporation protein HypA/HybF
MHELTIAQNIIELISETVPEEEQSRIKIVNINAGLLSNISPDSLLFCFNSIKEKTRFNSAELSIDTIPISIECRDCGEKTTENDFIFKCKSCASGNIEVLSGYELNISGVILE